LPSQSQIGSNTRAATAGLSDNMSDFDIVPLKVGITGVVKTYNLLLYMLKLHLRNSEFFGREDILQKLNNALSTHVDDQNSSSSQLKTFAICGVGGLGKAQIATEFAYRSQKNFDAVFLLQASDTGKLAQSYAEIAGLLGLE
jgi:hypothetical protein